jgi:hypothetical protein
VNSPRFVAIIGAQRSGTTWLYRMLDAHPAITMAGPVRPEPKSFLDTDAIANGRDHYLARFFSGVPEGQLLGEKGTSYIEHPVVADRIRAYFPQAKAIAIVRDPVQRALSNYHFTKQHGLETRSLREVFLDEVPRPTLDRRISVSPFDYLERGHYAEHLAPWRKVFGEDLKVLVFEELVGHAEALHDLYAWLGVEATFTPPDTTEAVNAREDQGPDPDADAVRERLARYFAPHIRALEAELGRRIDPWHDPIQ